ncbi:MAG: phosphodiester glycosidase family protein [Clostridia bacterium]|nr:phosphodiester glycosidase family protein [Clostridia bacterium]
MKKTSFRALAGALSLLLLTTLLPVSAFAAGPVSHVVETALGPGLTLTQENSRAASGSMRQQFLLDYAPGDVVEPLVLYGTYLRGKSPIQTVISYAQRQGYRVLAAVNADFFFTDSGIPIGMTIQNGRLCTTDGGQNAVGILPDGGVIAGRPSLSLPVTLPDGTRIPIEALNVVRSTDATYLYSQDFDPSTGTSGGTEVLLQITRGTELCIGRRLQARVLSVIRGGNTPIGEDQLVLSFTDQNRYYTLLSALVPGDELIFEPSTPDPLWEDVVWSSGAGNLLAENGALTSAAATATAPRTVLGVRSDGSAVILECDGRQPAVSMGISLQEAALQLLDRGCSTVVNLDGGGSSALAAAFPGYDPALLSSPSDGTPRGCATYLVFVTNGSDSGPAYGSAVYPRSATLLTGASMPVSAVSYNRDYLGFADATDQLESDYGVVSGGVFTAPDFAAVCTVSAGHRSQDACYTVTDQIDALHVTLDGKAVSSLTLERRQTVDLNVSASDGVRPIVCSDSQFTFTVSGDVGTVDENGFFTAGTLAGSGSVTVSYGSAFVTLPVTVRAKASRVIETLESLVLRAAPYASATASASCETALEHVRYGRGSARLEYSGGPEGSAEYRFFEPLTLNDASHLTFHAKGSGDWYALFSAQDGGTQAIPFAAPGDRWQAVTLTVPDGAAALEGFAARGQGSETLWLDQLRAHYGSVNEDEQPPALSFRETIGTLSVSFADDSGLSAENITLAVDGKETSFLFVSDTLTASLPDNGALHRITVTADDIMGNRARKSVDVGEPSPVTFADLNGHWAASYVEYLHEKGVFSTDVNFNPAAKVSNAMAATMLSRYLGVHTELYASVALPHADADAVPDWALPHVRAMYALGIMIGSTDGQGRPVLNPDASCTRAQIMTILGRTLERGYSYGPCDFDDSGAIPAWARDHVDLLTALGVVTGDQGKVNPTGTITRAEFAALLYRMY